MQTTGEKIIKKYFVSAILPGVRQLGVMQFEAANDEECREKSEKLCPSRAAFRSYEVEKFDDLPVNKFITTEELKELNY